MAIVLQPANDVIAGEIDPTAVGVDTVLSYEPELGVCVGGRCGVFPIEVRAVL
jgi:hypothetical protein